VDKARKREMVAWMKEEVFGKIPSIVIAHNLGLTVAQMTDLRNRMYEAGGMVKVVKNRLARIALEGTPREPLAALFTGPTVMIFSEDVIAAPKVAAGFAKENEKLVIIGGMLEETLLDEAGVKALATMPSLDELRGKLVGLIQAPAQKVASVVQAPAGQLARVLAARGEQEQAA
jgi:large subunit ribosomal protein L10